MTKASPFQAVKTWKASTDPDHEGEKDRVLHLYAVADGHAQPGPSDPDVVISDRSVPNRRIPGGSRSVRAGRLTEFATPAYAGPELRAGDLEASVSRSAVREEVVI